MKTAYVLDSDPSGHGQGVADRFAETLALQAAQGGGGAGGDYGWEAQAVGAGQDAGEADLIIVASAPSPLYESPWEESAEAHRPYVQAHGSNTHQRRPYPAFGQGGALFVGADDPATTAPETSYGPGLELDAVGPRGGTVQSWAAPTAAALLVVLYETRTGADLEEEARWAEARLLLRRLAAGFAYGGAGEDTPAVAWQEEGGYGTVEAGAAPLPPPLAEIAAEGRLAPPLAARQRLTEQGTVRLACRPLRTASYHRTVIEATPLEGQDPEGEASEGEASEGEASEGEPRIVWAGDTPGAASRAAPLLEAEVVLPAGAQLRLRAEDAAGRTHAEAPAYAALEVPAQPYAWPPYTLSRQPRNLLTITAPPVPGALSYRLERAPAALGVAPAYETVAEAPTAPTFSETVSSSRYYRAVVTVLGGRTLTAPALLVSPFATTTLPTSPALL